MKKLDLWRRRDGAATLPPDAPTTEAAVAAEAPDRAEAAPRDGADAGRGDDHEDTVPAAFYRSAG